MGDHFVCSICGRDHAGLPADWAYQLPDDVWAVPECDRADRAKFDSDLCWFENRFFIRCLLALPFTNASGYFGWGIWAEVDEQVFRRYLDLYHEDGSNEPLHPGKTANILPPYGQQIGVQLLIQFRDSKQRPSLHLLSEDDSELARDQRGGIGEARYHQILQLIGYRN